MKDYENIHKNHWHINQEIKIKLTLLCLVGRISGD